MCGEYLANGDFLWIDANRGQAIEGYSGATTLGLLGEGAGKEPTLSLMDMFLGFEPGSIGETSTLAILIGGFILAVSGIGSFRIMISVFIGGLIMGLLLNAMALMPAFEGNMYMAQNPLLHLFAGGFAFGAVFMATDPVTAAQTENGKIYYG